MFRKNIAIWGVSLLVSAGAYAAEVDLFSAASEVGYSAMSPRAAKALESTAALKEVKNNQRVSLSPSLFSSVKIGDKVVLNIKGSKKSVAITELVSENASRTFIRGQSGNVGNRLQIVKTENSVAGTIYLDGTLFKIKTVNDEIILSEYDVNELNDHGDDYVETLQDNSRSLAGDAMSAPLAEGASAASEGSGEDSGDVIDVIVAYTSMFASAAVDPLAAIDLAIYETNTSFENSNINTRVNLVHAYQTNYQDTGSFAYDLGNIQSASSTHGNELRALRDQHSADIMMLLTGNIYDGCGQARVINADESNAIAVVKESCATGVYTFGHEIGHLMGARHTLASDSQTTPFAYGHAYCNSIDGSWKTVMASSCSTNTRVQQWSNPNVSFQGAVTGTAEYEDNARVLNERRTTVANFRVNSSTIERTVVFIYGQTQAGQDMFVRGGLDHGYANGTLGRNCDATNFECALPIQFLNTLNATTAPWKVGDTHLDWYGREAGQNQESPGHGFAEGTAMDWTIDHWPSEWGPAKYYDTDGSGEDSENTYGAHFWKLDVLMDCSNTVNGWFELKSYISNGPGWEGDVSQGQSNGEPYVSQNHFAQCGRKNVFFRDWVDVNGYGWRGPNDVIIEDL